MWLICAGMVWCQLGEPCLDTETAPEPDTEHGDTNIALLILHHTHLPSSSTPACFPGAFLGQGSSWAPFLPATPSGSEVSLLSSHRVVAAGNRLGINGSFK